MSLTLFESDDRILQTALIKDGFGNQITLPKWGCCSWAEKIAIEQELNKDSTATEQQTNIVTAFIRLRLKDKIKAEISDTELLSDRHGFPLPEPMIENLYHFAMAEYNRDQPKNQRLTLIGEDAESTAIAYAEKHGCTVITRTDLALQNIFYVFTNSEILNSINGAATNPYIIVQDYSESVQSVEELGKSKQKKTGT